MIRRVGILLCGTALAVHAADDVWSVAQITDTHCPMALESLATNFVPFVLSHTNDGLLNFRVITGTGDLYEQANTASPYWHSGSWPASNMAAAFSELAAAGLPVVLCNGGHDADFTNGMMTCWGANTSTNPIYWEWLFPLSFFSSQTGFIGSMQPGDSRSIAFAYTNGSTKLLFLTYRTLHACDPETDYFPQTVWMTNMMSAYPDHNVIVLAHYFLGFDLTGYYSSTMPFRTPVLSYMDGTAYNHIGPALEPFLHGFLRQSNLLCTLSGHTRTLAKGHLTLKAEDGHIVDVTEFNPQAISSYSQYINVLTFKPRLGTVTFSTWDFVSGRMLTNYDEAMTRTAGGDKVRYLHTWTTPLAVPRQVRFFNIK